MCIRDSPVTDLHQNLKALSPLQFTEVCKKLFDSVWICGCYRLPYTKSIDTQTDRQTDRHTDTSRKTTFFHVLRVVHSESAIISNTIFFAITILPFLKEYGSDEFHKEYSVPVSYTHLDVYKRQVHAIATENEWEVRIPHLWLSKKAIKPFLQFGKLHYFDLHQYDHRQTYQNIHSNLSDDY